MDRRSVLQIALFLTLLALPSLGLLLDVNDTDMLAERRRLAPRPALPRDLAALRAFPRRFERWFDDHFGFRSVLIRSNKEIEWRVKRSQVEMVVGSEGWLFLGRRAEIGRFRCVEPPEEHLAAWRDLAATRRDAFARRGIDFLWVLAPNKHTLYAEHMPPDLEGADRPCSLDKLARPVADAGVDFLDLRSELMNSARGQRLFHRTDTHWNQLGAFFAARAILERVSKRFPALTPPSLDEFDVGIDRGVRGGDIADMVRVYGEIHLEDRVTLSPRRPLRAQPVEGSAALDPERHSRPERMLVAETGDRRLPTAVVFHDSFGYALMPVLAEHFERIAFVRTDGVLDPAVIDAEDPDLVLVVMAEKKFAFAPASDLSAPALARRPVR